jgi:hypothetical protein
MAGGGSKKGERRGGRKAGTPDLRTTERMLLARKDLDEAKGGQFRLAKEYLREIMVMAHGLTGYYVPIRPGGLANPNANRDDFQFCAKLCVDAAKSLASYESPKLAAMMIQPPPPTEDDKAKERVIELTIFDNAGAQVRQAQLIMPSEQPKGKSNGHR